MTEQPYLDPFDMLREELSLLRRALSTMGVRQQGGRIEARTLHVLNGVPFLIVGEDLSTLAVTITSPSASLFIGSTPLTPAGDNNTGLYSGEGFLLDETRRILTTGPIYGLIVSNPTEMSEVSVLIEKVLL